MQGLQGDATIRSPVGRVVRAYVAICDVERCRWSGKPYKKKEHSENDLRSHHQDAHGPPVMYEASGAVR